MRNRPAADLIARRVFVHARTRLHDGIGVGKEADFVIESQDGLLGANADDDIKP